MKKWYSIIFSARYMCLTEEDSGFHFLCLSSVDDVGSLRLVVTIFLRVATILRYRGCGVWILAAFWGPVPAGGFSLQLDRPGDGRRGREDGQNVEQEGVKEQDCRRTRWSKSTLGGLWQRWQGNLWAPQARRKRLPPCSRMMVWWHPSADINRGVCPTEDD